MPRGAQENRKQHQTGLGSLKKKGLGVAVPLDRGSILEHA